MDKTKAHSPRPASYEVLTGELNFALGRQQPGRPVVGAIIASD